MAILNEYELHLLAMMSGIDEHATIENKQSLLVALDVLKPQGNIFVASLHAPVRMLDSKQEKPKMASPVFLMITLDFSVVTALFGFYTCPDFSKEILHDRF